MRRSAWRAARTHGTRAEAERPVAVFPAAPPARYWIGPVMVTADTKIGIGTVDRADPSRKEEIVVTLRQVQQRVWKVLGATLEECAEIMTELLDMGPGGMPGDVRTTFLILLRRRDCLFGLPHTMEECHCVPGAFEPETAEV